MITHVHLNLISDLGLHGCLPGVHVHVHLYGWKLLLWPDALALTREWALALNTMVCAYYAV